jgi:hypothetical protein
VRDCTSPYGPDCADRAEDGEEGSQRNPDGARLADRNVDAASAANGDMIVAVLGRRTQGDLGGKPQDEREMAAQGGQDRHLGARQEGWEGRAV